MAQAFTRPYGDAATSAFPKMGEEPLTSHLVNASGDRSPYTQMAAKHGPAGDPLAIGGKANRSPGSVASGEHNGPRFSPVQRISYPNAPEQAQTGRGLRRVPSRAGVTDFWDNRFESGKVIA